MINASAVISARGDPFAHVVATDILDEKTAENILRWFEQDAPWRLRIASFYEQYECNLHEAELPPRIERLVNAAFIEQIVTSMLVPITTEHLELVEVNAHKLVPGQTIKIHNDYIGEAETHRVLLQFNRGWDNENGGMLMLFGGPRAEHLKRVVRPTHCSATGFEISPDSFHAVSTIHSGARYTLVYTFKRSARFGA